jgi:hypothetical protein
VLVLRYDDGRGCEDGRRRKMIRILEIISFDVELLDSKAA